ncbi:hypothetical protein BB8028_0010g00200 [Beauveria bassiana]|uniref:Uncharacterized protein n=1 Tax=Beauveria bassiana TaxID=176275 RepID=A0A2S7YPG3_BEABA|nr:hypothetical protein BB8028_0010g00200 [Beauveria bassiana]
MSNFKIIQLPDDTPGLNIGITGPEDGSSCQTTPSASADRELVEAVRKKYEQDIFNDLPRRPGRTLRAELSLITLKKGNEFVAPSKGRTFLIYRGDTLSNKEFALTIENKISYQQCKTSLLVLVDAGTRIGMPTGAEAGCFPASIRLVTANFTYSDVKS